MTEDKIRVDPHWGSLIGLQSWVLWHLEHQLYLRIIDLKLVKVLVRFRE